MTRVTMEDVHSLVRSTYLTAFKLAWRLAENHYNTPREDNLTITKIALEMYEAKLEGEQKNVSISGS